MPSPGNTTTNRGGHMKVQLKGNACIVTKEKGDKNFYGVVNAAGESALLYHVKNILNKQGYDLIKKRMHKDGHLVSDMQQYLRARKKNSDNTKNICIYNPNWLVEGAEVDYNQGQVILSVEYNYFD